MAQGGRAPQDEDRPLTGGRAAAAEDTIAAIATPLGSGGLGILRLSGPEAFSIAGRTFRASSPLDEAPSHSLHHGVVHDGGIVLDDAVAALFRAPRSYTGEDVVEFSCHGSAPLLRRILDLLIKNGARLAGPGEFTKRAFLNGRMDLAQAEAVAALIAARSDDARRWALDQLRGGLSERLKTFREKLLGLLAHLEASLDFAEEEVPDLTRAALIDRTAALHREVEGLVATAPRGRLFRDGLRAVLVGRPNVGKSSLFNAHLGADRAIVTALPGTTRDTLEETLDVDGLPVVLTDTAGLREGAGLVETEGIARARRALEEADVVLWVMDAADPLTKEDIGVAGLLEGKRVISVLNKADTLPPGIDRMPLLDRARKSRPPAKDAAFVSARTGEGLAELKNLLLPPADAPARESADGPTLVNDRHEALLVETAAGLGAAAEAARAGDPDECLALELRRALDALNQVTGQNVSDEVLDAVFSRFCIGK